MTLPSCVLQLPGAPPCRLHPGDVLGRAGSAAMVVNDPRVSEMHAYVSLRGRDLLLIALRGRLAVDGAVVAQVPLQPGGEISLARDLAVTVSEVVLPEAVLTVESTHVPRQVPTSTCSLLLEPTPSLAPGTRPGAALVLWMADDRWHLRREGGPPEPLTGETVVQVGGETVRLWFAPLTVGATRPTVRQGRLHAPLHVRADYDVVHIERDGVIALSLSGRAAELISELAAFGGPAPWQVLAGEIWGSETPPHRLRANLDITLTRLRAKLRGAELRQDLVRPDGRGQLELLLTAADRLSVAG